MTEDAARHTNKLADIRIALDMTQQQVADAIGVSVQAYQNYEYGKRDIKGSVLSKMAVALKCSVNEILGLDAPRALRPASAAAPVPVACYRPVVGHIAAGTPVEAIEFDGGEHWVSPDVEKGHPNGFFLSVTGDSMDMRYPEGGMVYIDPDETDIVSGKCYAVLINGYDATLKQVFKGGDTVILHPLSSNPEHRDRTIDTTDPDAPFFLVVGRVVWYVGVEE